MGRRGIILAVVLVVVLAGCSGDDGQPAQTTTTATTMMDDGDGDMMDDETDGTTTDMMDDDGMMDGDSMMDGMGDLDRTAAQEALREAGSFTATWTFSGTDEDGVESQVGYTYYADLDQNRVHVIFSAAGTDQPTQAAWEMYSADGMTYTYFGSEAGAFYQVQQEELEVVDDAVGWAGIYAHGDMGGLERTGTEQFDGVTVARYELTDEQSMFWTSGAAQQAGEDPEVTVTDFRYVVLVDENGISRHEEWSYEGTSDGEPVSGSWEYSLTDVGSTTVAEPEWLEEAQAQG